MSSYIPAVCRGYLSVDEPFVYHSWLKSYRGTWSDGLNPVRHVEKERYYKNQSELIGDLLATSVVLVAANSEDIDQIFGYIVGLPIDLGLCIHYIFVKQPFRKLGVATLLFSELQRGTKTQGLEVFSTHATGVFHDILGPKFGITYDPYILWNHREGASRL